MADALQSEYFGPAAARQDKDLPNYFVDTKVYESISDLSDPRCIVVGKKGCGKTAFFRQLETTASPTRVVAPISPDTHQIPSPNADYSFRQYANMFEYEMFLEVLRAFLRSTEAKKLFSSRFKAKAKARADEYLKALGVIKERAKNIDQLMFFGSGVSSTQTRDKVVRLSSAQQSEELKKLIAEIQAKEVEILILVDDPDLLFGSGADPVNILGGLLMAAVGVTSLSSGDDSRLLKVCCFMKQHKHDLLSRRFEDFDHISRSFVTVSWEDEELTDLIGRRIRFRENMPEGSTMLSLWKKRFEITTRNHMDQFRKYLYPRIRSGPRDLITLCNMAMDVVREQQDERISLAVLKDIEPDYSKDCLEEVEREFGSRYPGLVSVIQKLFEHESLRTADAIDRQTVEQALSDRYRSDDLCLLKGDLTWLAETTGRQLLDILFTVGVVGYISKEGEQVMSYSVPPAGDSFARSNKLVVHTAYHRALGI